jgi:hypothetical protein
MPNQASVNNYCTDKHDNKREKRKWLTMDNFYRCAKKETDILLIYKRGDNLSVIIFNGVQCPCVGNGRKEKRNRPQPRGPILLSAATR